MATLIKDIENYRKFLSEEFYERKRKVPSYSLRAFAAKLGISPASLSQVLSGKRPLTKKSAVKIADRLCLTPDKKDALLRSVAWARADRQADAPDERLEMMQIELDSFRVISDWYHYAIWGLINVKGFEADAEWIAARLEISVTEVRAALERLERLGIIKKHGKSYRHTSQGLTTPTDIPSAALRKFHYQNLSKAEESLDRDPVEARDFSFITMAIDPKNIPKAKDAIKEFRRYLYRILEKGNKKQVYTLVIQLFPVDRGEKS